MRRVIYNLSMHSCVALILIGVLTATSIARAEATSPAVSQLVRNAIYWQERGREDKAAEAWGKVLVADPGNADALIAQTNYYTRIDRQDLARDYLNRLKEAHPSHPDIPKLERALVLGKKYDALLADARNLAKAGKTDEAIAKYKELFGGAEPPKNLALEYYQTLGGTPKGWPEARDGLQALAKRSPNDPRYQLALAKHLTYREESRREGIKMLEKLSSDPTVGKEADEAWRQALSWMGPGGENDALFHAYAAKHPGDSDIMKKVNESQKAGRHAASLRSAYAALDKGDLAEAEKQFTAAGDKDGEAVAGLGIIALKRQQFERAKELLEKAKALAPNASRTWGQPLKSARFWLLMKEARTARESKKLDVAEQKLLTAIDIAPEERFHADGLLAEIYLDQNKLDKCEARLRLLLKEKPESVDALRELIGVLIRTERTEEAIALNEKLIKLNKDKAFSDPWLRAEALRGRAARAKQNKQMTEAKSLLVQARDADPENYWVLHDLANLLLEMRELDQARNVVSKLLLLDPAKAPGRATLVRVLVAQGLYPEALEMLRKTPLDQMTPELTDLRKRLEFQVQLDALIARVNEGASNGARQELLDLELRVETQPDLAPLIAQAWAGLGDTEHAVQLMQRVLAKNPKAPAGARLQLAALLYQSGRDTDVVTTLGGLSKDFALLPEERQGLEDLRVAAAIRHADQLREDGQLEAAVETLHPLLDDYPDNAKLLCALGRVFETGSDWTSAYAIFMRVLERDADNLEARASAADSALMMGDREAARQLSDEGRRRAPADARMALLAGRLAVRAGDDSEAMTHFETARDLARKQFPDAVPDESVTTRSTSLTTRSSTPAMVREAMAQFSGKAATPVVAAPRSLSSEIQSEISQVEARHRIEAIPGLEIRRREGEPGLGLLTSWRLSVAGSVPIGYRGRLSLILVPTVLDGGSANLVDFNTANRFATAETDPATVPGSVSTLAQGTELRLKYSERSFSADVGSTPLGFPTKNITGGIDWHPWFGGFGFGLELSRRPVTDSLLSYAGMKTPTTGRLWGGLVKDGGRLDLSFTKQSLAIYLFGDYRFLHGTEVTDNSAIHGGAGVEWKVLRRRDWTVLTGIDLIYMAYQKNMRFFTFGQGGYFSPQNFIHIGVPVRWTGGSTLKWNVVVIPGFNWFREADTPYFPTDTNMQDTRASNPPTDPTDPEQKPLSAYYSGRTAAGFALDLRGQLSYPLTRDIELGADVQFHRADDYQEFIAGVFVKFSFQRGGIDLGSRYR